MKKWKKSVMVMMALGLMTGLAGCGGAKETTGNVSALEQAEPSALAAYIVENTVFKDSISQVDGEIFYSLYNLSEEIAPEAVLYSSTGATAEEVAVIQAADGKVEDVLQACEDRIQAQKEGFENYVPGELDKLSDPILESYGNTVILVVCDDKEAAKKLLDGYGAQEL
ncbi:DUF4358 domain-containing protein [Aminipila butyrica]|uniref:DUF4358 domain-containing protein n=1 Tax=Aminipila butyrica TaxID=433296 RepID=A0A858BXE6_9FIRM|nr:DUF4358 domain-containing protein [Aminipila butyrica]QIB70247.1 DUF4358 domain-containing protein [Aminipila butyrica]